MKTEEIGEAVQVGAVFSKNQVHPRWFIWRSQKRNVESVNMTWRSREGEAQVLHFSAASQGNLYELQLNQKTLEWRLEKVSL